MGDAFSGLIVGGGASLPAIALALGVAVLLGALHALEPGHGKAVMAGYLVGARGTRRHAVLLALSVTVTHTAGVFLLGAAVLLAAARVTPERLYPWLSLLSGLLGCDVVRRTPCGRREDDAVEPQGFAYGPRLEGTAPRAMRRLGVGDLGNVPEASLIEVGEQRPEEPFARRALGADRAATHSHPRLHERAEQPGPDRPLMVRAIARRHTPVVPRDVPRLARRE